ncbi:hypothetical protein BGZ80_000986 [Entomortierella chlamydospora]|uniref:BTB domain-containing protein n=1 Tax=Entomortierella chlamydospora TaxID=101097 RepID=A0A9P6MSA2_9FUNG|nr:hypothetical protein BGZ79_006894 [Entomortierella chlamydospora]KAG0011050.1 hypothetical protein BGZ80_000986 [Entomortierella chlamydospora]
MARLNITEKQERTFRIESPVLAETPLNNTTTADFTSTSDNGIWKITLTRKNKELSVGIEWKTNTGCYSCKRTYSACNQCGQAFQCKSPYSTMSIVPCKKPNASTSASVSPTSWQNSSLVQCTLKHGDAVFKDKYLFDIVLFIGQNIPVIPVEPLESVPKNRDIMLTLLKDINSVDTCFVFESDKSYSNVGLWAHRVILTKYKKFDGIIQYASKKATTALSEKDDSKRDVTESSTPSIGRDENPAVLTIPVPKDFSLSTLSVLLRYIYTGEIKLTADLGQHAVSMTKSSLVIYDAMGKTRESVRWSPFDADSPWKLKDVTWEELLLAADHFGVSDMRKNCEDEVIGAMNQSNVVDTLFNIGCSFDTVKEAALDFIVKNMETMVLDGEDPFVAFKNHPDCHSLMFEVMRRRVKKA